MPDFDFLRPRPNGMDFSPLFQGAAAQARGVADAGQSIGAGLIERSRAKERQGRLAEEKRQFDVSTAIRGMLAQNEDARMRMSLEREKRIDQNAERRMDQADARFQAEQNRHAKNDERMTGMTQAMVGAKNPDDLMRLVPFARTPSEVASIVGRAENLRTAQDRAAQQEAERAQKEQAAQAAGSMLKGYVKGGIIPKEMESLFQQLLQLDPDDAIRKMLGVAGEYANEQYDTGLIERSLKGFGETLKQRDKDRQERVKNGLPAGDEIDEDVYKELAALEATPLRGPRLQSEIARIGRLVQGVKGKAGAEKEPTLMLPGGKTVPAPDWFIKGGDTNQIVGDKGKMDWLVAAGELSAQSDRRWPGAAALEQALASGKESSVSAVQSGRDKIRAEHIDQLLSINGWKRGDGQAEQGGADSLEAIIRDRNAGKIDGAQLQQRAKALGLSFEQVKQALGGR